jgi:hypothetical protein
MIGAPSPLIALYKVMLLLFGMVDCQSSPVNVATVTSLTLKGSNDTVGRVSVCTGVRYN